MMVRPMPNRMIALSYVPTSLTRIPLWTKGDSFWAETSAQAKKDGVELGADSKVIRDGKKCVSTCGRSRQISAWRRSP